MHTNDIDWTTETITQEAIATVQVAGSFDVDPLRSLLAEAYGDHAVTVLDDGLHIQMPAARLLDHREVIEGAVQASVS